MAERVPDPPEIAPERTEVRRRRIPPAASLVIFLLIGLALAAVIRSIAPGLRAGRERGPLRGALEARPQP